MAQFKAIQNLTDGQGVSRVVGEEFAVTVDGSNVPVESDDRANLSAGRMALVTGGGGGPTPVASYTPLSRKSTTGEVVRDDTRAVIFDPNSVVSGTGLPGAPAGKVPVSNGDGSYSPGTAVTEAGLNTAVAASTAFQRVPAAPVSGRNGIYDSRLGIYNFKPSQFRRWHAAVARAQAGLGYAKWAPVGDSLTAAQSAVFATQAYSAVISRLFAPGLGLPFAGGPVGATQRTSGVDARWNPEAGWTSAGLNAQITQNSTAGRKNTYTSDHAGTIVDLFYFNTSAAFTYKIDGGSALSVTPTGAQTVGTITVTGLLDTTHTVEVTVPASGTVFLIGAAVRKATGLQVWNAGLGGNTAVNWANATAFAPLQVVKPWLPNLATVMLGTNDANQSVSAADYKTAMLAIVDSLLPATDVLLFTPPPASGLDLAPYRQVLYEVAEARDLPLLDLLDRFGSWATANANGQVTDPLHLNAIGYGNIARAVQPIILPG